MLPGDRESSPLDIRGPGWRVCEAVRATGPSNSERSGSHGGGVQTRASAGHDTSVYLQHWILENILCHNIDTD